MSILRMLGWEGAPRRTAEREDADAVRRIASALERLEPTRARFIASFAFLLSRVANADNEISSEEIGEMERLIREKAGLDEAQAALVVQIARTQNQLFGGRENFAVGQEFARGASRGQKRALLDCLCAVAAADGGVSVREDNEIRSISRELGLEHREFIAVRSRYRDALNVLRDGGGDEPAQSPPR